MSLPVLSQRFFSLLSVLLRPFLIETENQIQLALDAWKRVNCFLQHCYSELRKLPNSDNKLCLLMWQLDFGDTLGWSLACGSSQQG